MDGTKFWANVSGRMGYMRMVDLAAETGLRAGNLVALKNKGSVPRADQATKIAKAVGCTVEDLFSEAVKP